MKALEEILDEFMEIDEEESNNEFGIIFMKSDRRKDILKMLKVVHDQAVDLCLTSAECKNPDKHRYMDNSFILEDSILQLKDLFKN